MKMPAEMKAKWLEALRSGKYKQGKGYLETKEGSFCCLGVLQKVTEGRCENYSAPSPEWYEKQGIHVDQTDGCINDEIETKLMGMNDGLDTLKNNTFGLEEREYSFPEIADFIEKHVGVVGE